MMSPNQSWVSRYHSTSPSSSSPSSSRASSVDDPKPSDNSDAMEVFKSIYNGRKSWKTLRGGEMVWPAELEAALIEGLERYQPDDSRETRLLGRFPMRNRFISEYIYRKTGRRRTAKQVGSRLQQLRETCTGDRIMNLLSPCRRQVPNRATYGSDSASSTGSASVPITPTDEVAPCSFGFTKHPSTSRQNFRIDILPQNISSTDPSPQNIPSDINVTDGATRLSDHARHIHEIDPTLTFISQTRLSAESHFSVYSEGAIVFDETTSIAPLELQDGLPGTEGALLYKTSLAPNYWKTIAESSDPTRYTIFQEVVQANQCIYSAKYYFAYPAHSSFATPSPVGSQFDFSSLGDLQTCFGADSSHAEYQKSDTGYHYAPFDNGSWLPAATGQRVPQTLHHVPSHAFEVESSSGSISPISATFPGEFPENMNASYQGHGHFEPMI